MNELYKNTGVCTRCRKDLRQHQKVYPMRDNKQYYYCEHCEAITLGDGCKRIR